jgi:hypothetical protein
LTQSLRESGIGLAFETVLFPRRYGQPNLGFRANLVINGLSRLCTRSQSFSVGLFLFNAQALPEERGKSELFPITSQKRPSLTVKREEWRMNGLSKQLARNIPFTMRRGRCVRDLCRR